jgi:hypothetical protein
MMTTGQIPESRALDGRILAMSMTMTKVRVRGLPRVVRMGPGKGSEQTMGRGQGR